MNDALASLPPVQGGDQYIATYSSVHGLVMNEPAQVAELAACDDNLFKAQAAGNSDATGHYRRLYSALFKKLKDTIAGRRQKDRDSYLEIFRSERTILEAAQAAFKAEVLEEDQRHREAIDRLDSQIAESRLAKEGWKADVAKAVEAQQKLATLTQQMADMQERANATVAERLETARAEAAGIREKALREAADINEKAQRELAATKVEGIEYKVSCAEAAREQGDAIIKAANIEAQKIRDSAAEHSLKVATIWASATVTVSGADAAAVASAALAGAGPSAADDDPEEGGAGSKKKSRRGSGAKRPATAT